LEFAFYGSRPRLLRAPGLARLFNLTGRDFVARSKFFGKIGFEFTTAMIGGGEEQRKKLQFSAGRGTTVLVSPLAQGWDEQREITLLTLSFYVLVGLTWTLWAALATDGRGRLDLQILGRKPALCVVTKSMWPWV